MTSRNVRFVWRSDSSQLRADFQSITADVKRVQRALLQLGRTGDAANLIQVFDATSSRIQKAQAEVVKLKSALDTVLERQSRARSGLGGVNLSNELRELARIGAGRGAVDFATSQQAVTNLRQSITQVETDIGKWQDGLQLFNQRLAESQRLAIQLTEVGQGAFQRRVERAASPDSVNAAVQERLIQLEETRNRLIERRAQLEQRVFDQIDPAGRAGAQKELLDLRRQEEQALNQIGNIQAQRAAVEARLNNLGSQRVAQTISQLREGKKLADIQAPVLGPQASADLRQFIQLTERLTQAQGRLASVQQRAARPRGGFLFTAERLGISDEFERVSTQIGALDKQMAGFAGPGRLDEIAQVAPKLFRQIQALSVVTERYRAAQDRLNSTQSLTRAQQESLTRTSANYARLQRSLTTAVERGTRALAEEGILKPLNFDEITAQLGTLERTLIGAFRGFGRRFQATLQFSLSAGLIFGTQRFLREFLQSAIEVERAFVDIGTALEFDVEAPRGTLEFERQLEGIRIQVLGLANDYNILPTTANEVAFKMVARFQDMDNAIEATRAQLLALKISTIETDEVLRALTATAEAFANSVLTDVSSELSLQERLLARENAAIGNYSKALDLATVIQQRWGVDFEDTIEGVARAGPTFQSLGFDLKETSAIVAAVTRQLPGTGVQIAERLVRALGAFTTDETRDKLLELAEASDDLTLSLSDFEQSGKFVLSKIQSQIDQLDPDTLVELQQIIGQRREIEVVAALLGTADLQEDINSITDAAGAAEQRFSFLQTTARELINSIAAEFDSLAQNLTKLGVLAPFKLILRSADLFLGVLNKILEGLLKFVDALNTIIPIRIGDFGLGDLLTTAVAMGAALRSVLRTLQAIGTAQGALGLQTVLTGAGGTLLGPTGQPIGTAAKVGAGAVTAQFAAKGLQVLGNAALRLIGGFNALATRVGTFTLLLFTNIGALGENIKATYANIAAKLQEARASGSRAFQGVLAPGAGRALGIVGVVTALATVFFSTKSAVDASRASIEQHEDAVRQSRDAILAEAAARKASREETALDLAREEFRLARERSDSGGFGTQFLQLFDQLIPNLDKTLNDSEFVRALLRFNGISTEGLSEQEILRRGRQLTSAFPSLNPFGPDRQFDRRILIEGSAQRNIYDEAIAFENLVRAQIDEFLANRAKLDFTGQFQADGIGAGLQSVLEGVEAATSPEEVLALVPELEKYAAQWLKLANEQNITIEGIEGTIKGARERVGRLGAEVQIGLQSYDTGIAIIQEEIEKLQGLLEDTQDPQTQKELRAAIVELRGRQGDFIRQRLEETQAVNDAFLSQEAAIRANIAAVRQAIAELRGTLNRRAAFELIRALRELEVAQYQLTLSRIREYSQIRQSFARTPEDSLAALEDERRKIQREVANAPTSDARREALAALFEIDASIQKAVDDIRVREAIARARRQGPLLSNLTQLNSELAGLRVRLAQAGNDSVLTIELQNQILQNQVQQQQELLRAAQSYVLLQAGVNDAISRTQAELTNVTKELEFSVRLFGKNSDQVNQLKLRQEELKNQLINYQLELRDLNRRLGSDVTNRFEQAQLDLLQVMEKLQAPDLGPLERARLELERKNAEAAAQRAFFDDRLFQLQFAFETGEIGTAGYIAALQRLLEEVDLSTRQGQEIFLQIQGIIDGLTEDISDFRFNIPDQIRLPTLFEVRRALAADQLGVNYLDNRTQYVNLTVDDPLTLQQVLEAVESAFGSGSQRVTAGAAGITIGSF